MRLEARDQTELSLRSTDFIPGKPETVGVPQVRLAVVLLQLLRLIDISLFRRRVPAVAVGVVKGEDRERAVDHDSLALLLLVVVEHDATGESAHRHLARLSQHFLGPERDDPRGRLGLRLGTPEAEVLAQIPGGTAGEHQGPE